MEITLKELKDRALKISSDESPKEMIGFLVEDLNMIVNMQFGEDNLDEEEREEGYTWYIDYETHDVSGKLRNQDGTINEEGRRELLSLTEDDLWELYNIFPDGKWSGEYLLKDEDMERAHWNLANLADKVFDDMDLVHNDYVPDAKAIGGTSDTISLS